MYKELKIPLIEQYNRTLDLYLIIKRYYNEEKEDFEEHNKILEISGNEIKLKETTNYGDDYFNKITMVGDSNTMNMYSSGYIKGTNGGNTCL